MSVHMKRALNHLKKQILSLGGLVEESVRKAVSSLNNSDETLARRVMNEDDRIDEMEVDIEEECLKILALYQPVAVDLRLIVAILKINNDLERVGDLAVNIAERSAFLALYGDLKVTLDFGTMAEKTQAMLKSSLDALVNVDTEKAKQVLAADDEIDAINRSMYDAVKVGVQKHPDQIEALIHLLSVSRHLERIADLATNIAEDIIYMARGEIVRHRPEEYTASSGGQSSHPE